ncbi:hypothetical protein [Bacillus sp. M6-12]|uniref:hypothetical protein n=1 Tax=Bacillus sp. M6-12 TaxID=2054166 RepID=UPI0015E0A958|nr:hypothetical protein [Bacillus sp. M6-12]
MSYVILFIIVFSICMSLFSMEQDGFDDIPSEFDYIPEIANLKYQRQTYSYPLYLKYMI